MSSKTWVKVSITVSVVSLPRVRTKKNIPIKGDNIRDRQKILDPLLHFFWPISIYDCFVFLFNLPHFEMNFVSETHKFIVMEYHEHLSYDEFFLVSLVRDSFVLKILGIWFNFL